MAVQDALDDGTFLEGRLPVGSPALRDKGRERAQQQSGAASAASAALLCR
jgi:hypothetical protein